MTSEQKEEFKKECFVMLNPEALNDLRVYGRRVGVSRPTDKKKEKLIEDIAAVLCGELAPVSTNRGAPIKNEQLKQDILFRMNELMAKYGILDERTETLPPPQFDYRKALENFRKEPKEILFNDSAPRTNPLDNAPIYYGQLTKMNGVYFLLPLNCKPDGRTLTVPDRLVADHGLRDGDTVSCRMTKGANAYVAQYVETVNGVDARSYRRKTFEDCVACYPKEGIRFYHKDRSNSVTAKYLEWLIPIGKGQRGCIVAEPKAGKTSLLAELSRAVNALDGQIQQMVLLTAQAPEVVGLFRGNVKAENLVYTSYEDTPEKQVFAAEFLLKRAKRYAESGQDVLLLVDSFNTLARAYEETELSEGGRVLAGGMNSKTVQYLKNYFASARCLEGAGTLTILGAVSTETGDPADTYLANALSETSNLTLRLSERLAIKRVYPTVDLLASRVQRGGEMTSGEETEMERLICSQYLPSYGEEGLRQALASSEDYASFKRRILHTIKQ